MENTTEHEDNGVELTVYELGYHLVPTLSEDEIALRVGELQKGIAKLGGGIIADKLPEHFVLAYAMRKMTAGKWDNYDESFFGWIKFEAPALATGEWKQELEKNEAILRFLLIKTTREDPTIVPLFNKKEELLVDLEKPLEPTAPTAPVSEVSDAELDKQIEELVQ